MEWAAGAAVKMDVMPVEHGVAAGRWTGMRRVSEHFAHLITRGAQVKVY
jgi:hypothetical protein